MRTRAVLVLAFLLALLIPMGGTAQASHVQLPETIAAAISTPCGMPCCQGGEVGDCCAKAVPDAAQHGPERSVSGVASHCNCKVGSSQTSRVIAEPSSTHKPNPSESSLLPARPIALAEELGRAAALGVFGMDSGPPPNQSHRPFTGRAPPAAAA